MVHYNVESLLIKTDLMQSEFLNFDVICLTETWLNDSDVQFTGYNMYRRDRVGDRHGVCVYVNKNLYSRRRLNLERQNMEGFGLKCLQNTKTSVRYVLSKSYPLYRTCINGPRREKNCL